MLPCTYRFLNLLFTWRVGRCIAEMEFEDLSSNFVEQPPTFSAAPSVGLPRLEPEGLKAISEGGGHTGMGRGSGTAARWAVLGRTTRCLSSRAGLARAAAAHPSSISLAETFLLRPLDFSP